MENVPFRSNPSCPIVMLLSEHFFSFRAISLPLVHSHYYLSQRRDLNLLILINFLKLQHISRVGGQSITQMNEHLESSFMPCTLEPWIHDGYHYAPGNPAPTLSLPSTDSSSSVIISHSLLLHLLLPTLEGFPTLQVRGKVSFERTAKMPCIFSQMLAVMIEVDCCCQQLQQLHW